MHAAAVLKSPDLVHAVCQFQCGTFRDFLPIRQLRVYLNYDETTFDKSVAPVLTPWFAEYGSTRLALLVRHVSMHTQRMVAMYAVHGEPLNVVQCLHEHFNAVATTPQLEVVAAARNRLDVLEFLFDIQYPVQHGPAVLRAATLGHHGAADMLLAHAPQGLLLDDDWSSTLVHFVTTKQWALVDRLLPKLTRDGAVLALAAAVACGDLDRAELLQCDYGVADALAATSGRGYRHAAEKCSLRGLQWIFNHWSAEISDRQRHDAEGDYFRRAAQTNPRVDVVAWLADRVVCTNYKTLEAVAVNIVNVHPNHVRTILGHVSGQQGRPEVYSLVLTQTFGKLAGYGDLDTFQLLVGAFYPRLRDIHITMDGCMVKATQYSRLNVMRWLMSSGHVGPSDVRATLSRPNKYCLESRGTLGDCAMRHAFQSGQADMVVSMSEMDVKALPVVFDFSHDVTNGALSWLCTGTIPRPPPIAIETTSAIEDTPAMDAPHPVLACVQHLVANRGGRATFLGEFLVEITRHCYPKHLFRRVHRAWRRLVPSTSPDRATIHQRCWDEAIIHRRSDILARLAATGAAVSKENLVAATEYGHIGLMRAILETTTRTPHGGLVDECRAVARARGHVHIENFLQVWPNLDRRARSVV